MGAAKHRITAVSTPILAYSHVITSNPAFTMASDPPWHAQIRTTTAMARRIARDQMGLPTGHLTPLGEGWDFITFLCDDTWVLRFPKRAECERVLLRERDHLNTLAGLPLPAAIPGFEHVCSPSDLFPWHCVAYRKLQGEPLIEVPHRLTPELAHQVGEFLAVLHAADIPRRSSPWEALEDNWREREFLASIDAYPPELAVAFEAWLAQTKVTPPAHSETFTHNDLNAEHILVDAERGGLTGIIDWADADHAPPLSDFIGLAYLGDPAIVDAALDAYGQIPDTQARAWLHAQALGMCIGQIHYGFRAGKPALLEPAVAAARRLFATMP
ncbi:MAG: phosphotransferase [Pseudomonadota bacterium]